jgi:hypothetical protein
MKATGGFPYSWVFAGLATHAGLTAFAFSVAVGGAGHGWCSPARVSLIALPLGPLTLLACVSRYHRWARGMCILFLAAGFGSDILLFALARGEGLEYAAKAWARFPEGVIGWGVCWVFMRACQVGALWAVRRPL